jgi:hypothetical protein
MKRVVAIFFFIFLISASIIPFGNAATSYTSNDKLTIGANINSPILMISVNEDYLNLGNITPGYITNSKQFNVINEGTADVTIQPQVDSPDGIFSNLFFATSNSSTYKKIGDFTGNISKSSILGGTNQEDFWVKLDLKNYNGSVTGNLSTDITFFVMSNE